MANNLARFRGKHGLTQEQLGDMLGVSKAAISYLEKHRIGLKAAQTCANALNENVFSILGEDALRIAPKTEDDKRILISMIESL